ncbi:MAG: FGGY family carbohydrate kinase [Thiogranum sp.]|nr:FGGY family carbohydrate kinase [Thiogranum sp.]
MNYILAIDQGTHASRALLFDARGRSIARHLIPVPLQHPKPGRVEQDAALILDSVRTAVREVLAQVSPAQRRAVRCCGITTQRSTVLAWRPDGTALSPAINWQDTRGARAVERLAAHSETIRRLSGLPLSAHYGASKLHHLRCRYGDDQNLRTAPLASFLLNHLVDPEPFVIDHANAQRMQLLDIDQLEWSQPLCDWFEVPVASLPACVPVTNNYGCLLEQDIPVTAVSGDQNAAWFEAGAPPAGTALVNLGSGAFVLTAQHESAAPAGLLSSIVYSNAAGRDYVIEGTVNGAGNALDWLHQQHGIETRTGQLDSWLEQIAAPPVFLNTVGGLGSPWWQRQLAPEFVNDTGQFSAGERAAGVAESILFLIQYNLEQATGKQPLQRLHVSGGLSGIDALCRKLADLTQCPVQRCESSEASARGIAWLAAGRPADWQRSGAGQQFEPHVDNALQARYQLFIERLQQRIAQQHD